MALGFGAGARRKRPLLVSAFADVVAAIENNAAPYSILVLGDSIAEGFSASLFSERWVESLDNELRSRTGRDASVGFHMRAYYAGSSSPWWTYGGGVTANGTLGVGLVSATMPAAATASATLPNGCTGFDVYYHAAPALGSIEVRVNSVLQTTINTTTGNAGSGRFVHVSGSFSNQTVQLTAINAVVAFDGIWTYTGDEADGIKVLNGGKSGASLNSFNSGDSGNHVARVVQNAAPDLLIVGLGSNDWVGGASAATITTRLASFVTKARTNVPAQRILFQIYNERADQSSAVINHATYKQTIYQAAIANNCDVIDWSGQIGSFVGGTNPYAVGDAHLTSAGHTIVRDTIANKLTAGA